MAIAGVPTVAADADKPLEGEVEPEDYWRTRRLRDIADARAELRNVKNGSFGSGYDDETICLAMKQAATNFVLEIETLLHRLAPGEKYLHDITLGEIGIEASRRDLTEFICEETGETSIALDQVHAESGVLPVGGLAEFLELDSYVNFELVAETRSITAGKQTVGPVYYPQVVPRHISQNAWRAANAFCEEIGLNLRVDDQQEAQFDYSDILEK